MIQHGIVINENEDNIAVGTQSEGGIPVVFGTAPVHLVEDPKSAVNRVILCKNIQEAKKKLGYSEDFASFTLCQSMKMSFLEYKLGPVAFVNVLDPEKHCKDFSEQNLTVERNQASLYLKGVLLDSLKVMDSGNELVKGTDYIVSRKDETVQIVFIGEKAGTVTEVVVTGKQIDASMVSYLDVIGGYDEESGTETGLELVRQVYPTIHRPAGMLLAPGFSHIKEVGTVIQVKCENINGCFRADCILDIDTESCKKQSDLEKAKKDAGYTDKHTYLVWPMARRDGLLIYGSAVAAATTQHTDITNGNIPNVSPSNKEARIDAAVLADGTEIVMDFEQASAVNDLGIATFVNIDGWKLWGNYSAAYPERNAMNVRYWCIRRFFTWHGNNFIMNNLARLDSVANKKLIEAICDEENLRCNGYVSAGVCAAASIEFTAEDNTAETLMDARLIFRQKLGVYGPAQLIENNLEYDLDSVRESLVS